MDFIMNKSIRKKRNGDTILKAQASYMSFMENCSDIDGKITGFIRKISEDQR